MALSADLAGTESPWTEQGDEPVDQSRADVRLEP